MKKTATYLITLAVFTALAVSAGAQTVSGRVSDAETHEIISGATVRWSGSDSAALTDGKGRFSLDIPNGAGSYIIAKSPGYYTDSVAIAAIDGDLEFALYSAAATTEEVVVPAFQQGIVLSGRTLQKTETISQAGLLKMACCNLSESFENSAAVTVGFTDAVSGAKQVQLLGLAGIYSQTLAENVPVMRGLAATYGWSYTPGTWLESIQISKGASSVINGYESISGQMNLEFRKPNNTETLFVNLYMDDALKMEANVTAAVPVAKNLWAGLLLHGSTENRVHDRNGDGFLDMPRTKLVNAYNRWFYLNPEKNIESRTGIKFIYEDRNGGQAHPMQDGRQYKTAIENRNFTVYNKTGIGFRQKEGQSLGIITSFTHHEQGSAFGLKNFEGTQNSFYFNTLFGSWIGSPDHAYTTGVSFMYDNFRTSFSDDLNGTPRTPLDRNEIVPGAYLQYTYSAGDKFTLLLGARGDWNSKFGWLFTPRANVRYAPWEFMVLRASAGRGFRSPNVIAENIGLMASSRAFDVAAIDGLDIERAWNFGGNISFYIPIWNGRKATLSLDYFRTAFDNQVIVDTERDPQRVYFYNLKGRSFADAWQADLSFTAARGLDIFAAFRYNDTRISLHDPYTGSTHLVEKPLVSRYRGLVNVSYFTNFKKWVFDYTVQVNGPSRLPGLNGYGTPAEHSPVFWIHFFQITKNTKRFDIYVGIENIFDFRQKDPILNRDNPFGPDFDSSRVWGPLMGRRIYGGIRLRIGKL